MGGSVQQTGELWEWQSVEELALQERIASQAAGADSKSGQRSGSDIHSQQCESNEGVGQIF